MPSGSKKRKAAKKKEQQSNNNPGGDDVGVRSNVINNANIKTEEVNVADIESEFKIEDESNEKGERDEYKDASSKSYDGGSSRSITTGSSSSSSEDESHGIKKADSLSGREAAEATESAKIHGAGDSVSGNVAHVISEKIGYASSGADDSLGPPLVESVSGGNKEPNVSSSMDKVGESFTDPASGQKEASILVEKIATISDPKGSALQGTNDQLNLSYNAPKNEADRVEDLGVAEPLLAPAPPPVQTTSWKSCCGLFEMFR